MASSLFPITGVITWMFRELSLASKENPLACSIAVSRKALKFIVTTSTSSLFWTMDTLVFCSDDDINNDVSSLDVEIIEKNRSYYKCTICGRKLSRKQTQLKPS